jgi:integrase
MPRTKLTVKHIAKLQAPTATGKDVIHWDTDLRGFGIRCSGTTNNKSFVVQRDLPGGNSRRVTIAPTNVLSLDDARARAEAVLADFYRGIDPRARGQQGGTLQQALDDYLAARKTLRPKSVLGYTKALQRLGPWLEKPLCTITPAMVEARHRELPQEIAAASGGRYQGQAMANVALKVLSTLWNFAKRRDPDLPANPVRMRLSDERQWFPIARRERMVKEPDLPQFYAALMALPNLVARDYLLLLLFTGLRRTEAATLTWDDVDFPSKVIRVPAQRTKANRKLDLPMTDVVHAMLAARRALGRSKYVFPANGAQGHIVNPKQHFVAIAAATGIRVSAHDLRRTFITVAESCDIPMLALKALVNHELGSGVTAGYVIMNVERLRAPAQRVVDRIKQLATE